jgi:putative tricarboxylic transport membrane protein
MLEGLITGFQGILTLGNLAVIVVGVIIGIIIGALPGLGPTVGMAMLMPITYGMDPTTGIVFLLAMYMSAEYGGSVSAILINTPGTAAAIATVIDGYPLAKNGYPGKALGVSLTASTLGGLFSVVCLICFSLPLIKVALKFGPPEYFALGVFGLSLVATLSGKDIAKGLLMAFTGLFLTTIGIDPISGSSRFTFGIPALFEGIPLVPTLLGLYALSEFFSMVEAMHNEAKDKRQIEKAISSSFLTGSEIRSILPASLRGGIIGTIVGVIPGAGGSIACWIAYDQEKRLAKDKSLFGKGDLRGIAAPESANNATVGGAMIPLMTLGIPGSPTTAVLLGALMLHGLMPGPDLFEKNPDIVYGIFVGLCITCFAMFIIGFALSKVWSLTLNIQNSILAPVIFGLCIIGAYCGRYLMLDVYLALGFGVLGYIFKKCDYPMAPLVLALVLGGIMESNLRRSLLISVNHFSIFFTRPISCILIVVGFLSFFFPLLQSYMEKKRSHALSK